MREATPSYRGSILIPVVIALSLLLPMACAGLVGTASIEAPAVIIQNNTGSLTPINVTVTTGNGTVSVSGPPNVANSTYDSAEEAAAYAANYLQLNRSRYDFYYVIDSQGNVSGPSAGAAMTVIAISALSGRHILDNFTMTGTISENGSIGEIGGVYDKVGAAKRAGLSFVLVPWAGTSGIESEIYALVQATYNIPLIQVANVSQAFYYGVHGINASTPRTNYSAYTPYDLSAVPVAPLQCSNSCSPQQFATISGMTINLTRSEIAKIGANPNFLSIYSQLQASLNQSEAFVKKGYLYAGSNDAFLTYLNAYFFSNYLVTSGSAGTTIKNVGVQCYTQIPPPLTNTNYEYVLGGELRQSWGEYTTNFTLDFYNTSIETTDDLLVAIYKISEASGWCNAAMWMYNIGAADNGVYVTPSQNLSAVASARVARAIQYGPSMYLTTAEQALAVNNYPLAILAADYNYAIANASEQGNLSTQKLLNMTNALARNSTFGVWATQFANEALLYATEAGLATNQSDAHSLAESAYSSALLASQFSTDMKIISGNFTSGYSEQKINSLSIPPALTAPTNQTTPSSGQQVSPQLELTLYQLEASVANLDALVIVLTVVNVVLLCMILYLLLPAHKHAKEQLKAKQSAQRARRPRNPNG